MIDPEGVYEPAEDGDLIRLLKLREGFEGHIYYCPAGHRTIGYGTNLDAGISRNVAEAMLRAHIEEQYEALAGTLPWVRSLPERAQRALAAMCYQLGPYGVFKFRKMLEALERRDYDTACAEARDSKWHDQTPRRVEDACRLFLAAKDEELEGSE